MGGRELLVGSVATRQETRQRQFGDRSAAVCRLWGVHTCHLASAPGRGREAGPPPRRPAVAAMAAIERIKELHADWSRVMDTDPGNVELHADSLAQGIAALLA